LQFVTDTLALIENVFPGGGKVRNRFGRHYTKLSLYEFS